MVSSGGNVTVGVGGTANVAVFATTGEYVTGVISATGNITGGNILTAGLISATSTITSAANITGGNVLTGGLVSATSTITSAANITGGNVLTSGLVSATGNVSGNFFVGNGRVTTGILFSNTSDATTASLTVDDFYLSAITALSVTNSGSLYYLFDQYSGNNPTIYAVAGSTLAFRLAVTGHPFLIQNVGANYSTGLNHVTTTGTVVTDSSAQGKVTGTLYWKIPGNAVGNYTYQCSIHGGMVGNIVVSSPTAGSFTSLIVTGNITGGNLLTGGLISSTGTITGSSHLGAVVSVTANVTGGNVLTAGLISATSTITSAANITGGNVLFGSGIVSGTGNIYGGNIIGTLAPTTLVASGNITGGNLLTGGLISATANITGGNVLTAGLISATSTITSAANITGGNILTAGLISATGTITSADNLSLTGNIVDIGELWINTTANGNINLNVNGTGQTNIPTGILSVTGNVQSGNLRTAGLISATGNITGGNLIGIYANGTSNISIPTISANILFSTAGNANVLVIANTGIVANVLAPTTATPANGVGYIGLPVSSITGTGTLTIVDAGKLVYVTAASQTVTIPANGSVAFPIGTAVTFIAGPSATTVLIAITTDTMYLGGIGTTGTRTLAAYGMATAVKVASTTWFINGTGLT